MAYISYTDVETFLNIDLTAGGQALVNAIISGIKASAEQEANRVWDTSGNQTETFDGGGYRYFVKHPPINTVVSVTIDDELQTAGSDEDYVVYDDYVQLTSRAAYGLKTVVIVYTY